MLLFCLGKVKMNNYRTPDEVARLLFDDNQKDSSTSDRLEDDDNCSDYVPLDYANEENIILSDPEYDSEDNNDNTEANDASEDTSQTSLLQFYTKEWYRELGSRTITSSYF